MSVQFSLVKGVDGEVLTVFEDGEVHVIHSDHKMFNKAFDAARAGESVKSLINLENAAREEFLKFNYDFDIRDSNVWFRPGSEWHKLEADISGRILTLLERGESFKGLANFVRRVFENPSHNSRTQFFSWIDGKNFNINPDGSVHMFKAVCRAGDEYESIHSGTNAVAIFKEDGEVVEIESGCVPQGLGDIVVMTRSFVDDNVNNTCSTGLHVSTYGYAREFGGRSSPILMVEVGPENVVSVPDEYGAEKVRVSEYLIVSEVEDVSNGGHDITLGQWVETDNHEGFVVKIANHPTSNEHVSVQLDTQAWISLPKSA